MLNLKDLQARCLQGDEQAWVELYSGLLPLARSICVRPPFGFDAGTAADIAQEVMLELTRKLHQLRLIKAFVARVTHNKCVDRVRKKKEIPMTTYTSDEDASSGLVENLRAPDYLPESMDDSRVICMLQKALGGLGEPCSKLLQARYFDELSYEDVARQTQMPAGQVGVYIGRCLARLRKAIQKVPDVWGELEVLMTANAS